MIILGLDISTSSTGWCIISQSGDVIEKIEMGFIDLSKEKSMFRKARIVKDQLTRLHIMYSVDRVCIEENLQSFRSGFSSAQTLSTLARFNGMVSYLCYEEFSYDPEFMNVNTARKSIGIKLIRKKDGGKPTKDQVLEWVSALSELEGYSWPTKTLKSGPRKGKTILDPKCFDMADAYVMARAAATA